MSSYDGIWRIRRIDGLLPPMPGMRKYIAGGRGETRLGPLVARFVVDGTTLRYRTPFLGFVDVLEEVGDGRIAGRATFRGRTFGRFELIAVSPGRPREPE